MPPRSRHTRVRRLAIASAPSDAGDGVGAYAVADTSEQRARGAAVCDEEFDTIGGLVLQRFGRVPKRGEQLVVDQLSFRVLRADGRRIYLLQVAKKLEKPTA